MKSLISFILFISFTSTLAQKNVEKIDTLGVDVLGATYLLKNNTIYKKYSTKTVSYLNVALGDVYSVDMTNAQEIVVFYRNFNTVVILDNQLNELHNITFNDTILFVSRGISNKLWRFNNDTNKIELYDHITKKVTESSLVITDLNPIKMESGFNEVKLSSKNKTLIFNRYLNLRETINHQKNP